MRNSRFIPLPGQGFSLPPLGKQSLGHIVFSRSPSTQTAKSQPQAPLVLQAIAQKHPNTVCSVAQTPLPPHQQRWREVRENLHNHRLTRHLCADLENKQRIRVPEKTGEETHDREWNHLRASNLKVLNEFKHYNTNCKLISSNTLLLPFIFSAHLHLTHRSLLIRSLDKHTMYKPVCSF